MKNLSLVFITFLFTLFCGCQENFINQPETEQIQKFNRPDKHSLKICCELRDPSYGVCNINGCVDYTLRNLSCSQNPTALNEIAVGIYMDSKLCDKLGMVHLEWRAEGRSDDIVYVSEEGIVILEKFYWITNRSDVVLLVRYLITTNGIGIANMNLAPLEKEIQNNIYKEN